MTRDKGFARGDLDPSFPIDDKFLALRKLVTTERYYAATGVYFHMAAATWREAERKPAAKVCPDATEIVADLVSVGLLDKDGKVPLAMHRRWLARRQKKRRMWQLRGELRSVDRPTVYALFNGRCAYCGDPATHIDHRVPLAKGGTNELSNLVPACRRCNQRKGASDPALWPLRVIEGAG